MTTTKRASHIAATRRFGCDGRHRVLPQFATGTVLRLCVSARQDGFLMCTKQCLTGTVPNVVFDGVAVSIQFVGFGESLWAWL